MKRTFRYHILLTFSITVLVGMMTVAVEYGLRYFTNEQTGRVIFIRHPTALATLKPNFQKTVYAGNKQQYTIRINRIGARDDLPPCANPDILLFGDSNLFAGFMPFELTLGEQLEAIFGNRVCSINFGVPGYGPDQSLMRMKHVLDRQHLRPRVIVFHVFADNDYGDLFRNNIVTTDDQGNLTGTGRTESDFKLDWLEMLQARSLIWRRIRNLARRAGYDKIPDNAYLPERSGAYLQARPSSEKDMDDFIRHVEHITQDEFRKYQQGMHTTWLGDMYDYAIALSPGSEAAVRAGELMTAILREVMKESDAVNACLVVLIQPSEWDVTTTGPVTYVDMSRYSVQYGRDYNRRNLVNIAKRAAIANDIPFIDLFDLFSAHDVHAYLPIHLDHGDNHWNVQGIRITAKALHDLIKSNGCL